MTNHAEEENPEEELSLKKITVMIEDRGATFSDDRKYRYCLWRIWDKKKPLVMFIGLNPSTANEAGDDPTIRRVRQFAIDWDYGGVYMMNLFAWVTSHPEELERCYDPIGDNDRWLKQMADKCDRIIFAWGSFSQARDRSLKITKMFQRGHALIINKDGSPRHPLYVKSDISPVFFLT